jgi:hypothetical protein
MKKEHKIIKLKDFLYVLSDEEIEKRDWFINLGSGGHPGVAIYRANSENLKAINEFKFSEIKKIIATTDPELRVKSNMCYECNGGEGRVQATNRFKGNLPCNNPDCVNGYFTIPLPCIPQHIIEAYVKKPFDEVEVEYDVTFKKRESVSVKEWNKAAEIARATNTPNIYLDIDRVDLKLNQDGTLAVSLVEENIEQKMLAHFNGKRGSFLNKKLIHEIVEWIKENL